MKTSTWICLAFALCLCSLRAQETDYAQGVLFLNEDWFGHQNSTINFLHPNGEWDYRVFQKENPGMELGGTSQYGTVFNQRLYIISKQDRDMGASISGGRITVCDAKTMKCITQIQNIATDSNGNSVADGRGFVGITPKKGYISTSNGIYVFNLETLHINGMIAGTGNDRGSLYSAQCGMMVCNKKYVFSVHQKKGLLIIDAQSDTVMQVIGAPFENGVQRGFGSVVQSKDSMLWLSVTADVNGSGKTVDYFLMFNPETFDTARILLPQGYGLPNSWYAWTADAFCASAQQNKLYWKKQDEGWFTSHQIVCYDIDKNECSDFFDSRESGWYIYCGAGFRVHPKTDEMYVSFYMDNLKQAYQTVRLSSGGELLASYEMIDNYWFPAMPIFPELSQEPNRPDTSEVSDSTAIGRPAVSLLRLYPNPTTDYVYVSGEYSQLQIYDLTGRLVQTHNAKPQIPVADMRPGVYVFCLTDIHGYKAVHKIMIR
ncbi:MAG: DUF5074 domain-containing protein [Lentimicrobiaceae bacterium]|nr:DUF5074 domain-containing protein [Lentimicrobiaceae bacterium]